MIPGNAHQLFGFVHHCTGRVITRVFILLCALIFFPLLAAAVPNDMVLMLDNSGSMKKNDPQFLASKAVSEFIDGLSSDSNVAVIIFDQDVELALPLTPVNDETIAKIKASIDSINYRGLYTNSPDALERAIYELKLHARPDAEKSIIFLTDGIVDTGQPAKDIEKARWMREDLAASAADQNIRIFGIAFTDGADFSLIQSLAQRTEAEYFRAFLPQDIAGVFAQIKTIIATPRPEPEPPPPPETIIVEKEIIKEVRIETPAAPPESKVQVFVLVGIGIFLALLIMYQLRRLKTAAQSGPKEYIPPAELVDMDRITGQERYDLSDGKLVVIGRVAGKKEDEAMHIVIDQSSMSRRHATIEFKNHSYCISDQGSGNGTFVNGQRIGEEHILKHDDRIAFDKFTFLFQMPEMEESDATVVQGAAFGGSPPPFTPAAPPLVEPDEDVTAVAAHRKSEQETASESEDLTEQAFASSDEGDSDNGREVGDMSKEIEEWSFDTSLYNGDKAAKPPQESTYPGDEDLTMTPDELEVQRKKKDQ
ncbi:MAG: hypothetical protein BMS9Abin15_0381 [Gammaproteobacteria bacterium]|nr:MAG: hypothetical protein BMS9Abin15_0381 [Gammaproteobacteria bacterium]